MAAPANPHELLSLSKAAQEIGISRSAFAAQFADKIPSVKVTDRSERRWPRKVLWEWVEQNAKAQA